VRAAAEDEALPVPSPTFLLQNIYDELEGAQPLGSGPVTLQADTALRPCMCARTCQAEVPGSGRRRTAAVRRPHAGWRPAQWNVADWLS